jgi:hypothetical protein
MTTAILILINCLGIVLLGAAIYFTHAGAKRAFGALIGGIVAAILGLGLDVVGANLGWWRYTGPSSSHAPLLVYLAVAFVWSGLSLISWRLGQRLGWKVQAILIIVIPVFATIQDYLVAGSKYRTQIISPGIVPAVGDVMVWLAVTVTAQGILSALAGNSAPSDK